LITTILLALLALVVLGAFGLWAEGKKVQAVAAVVLMSVST